MKTYDVRVVVEYFYEVEADTEEEAIATGWEYENYAHFAEVETINVTQTSDDEDEESNDN